LLENAASNASPSRPLSPALSSTRSEMSRKNVSGRVALLSFGNARMKPFLKVTNRRFVPSRAPVMKVALGVLKFGNASTGVTAPLPPEVSTGICSPLTAARASSP
jgi:hypothetical protein